MRAVVIDRCCAPEDLHVSELPMPEARQGWVVVRVVAAGLNHSESLLRRIEADRPYINTPVVPGIECVGEVYEVYEGSRFSKGERVVAMMGGMGRSFNGSYAEYALLPEHHVFHTTSHLDWLSLAAVPETFWTVYGSLRYSLLLAQGDTLLIRGATSTVGRAAIQVAQAIGAVVVVACRRENAFPELRALGADYCVVDNGRLAEQELPAVPNKVLELVGPKTLQDSMRLVSHPGYVCVTGLLGGQFTLPNFSPIGDIPNGVFLSGFHSNSPTQQDVDEIFSLIDRYHIEPHYARVFTLGQVAEAHRLLDAGTAGGKIILKIAQ